jgi:predicted DCC family thiol-disulfide oxidoreductase YuxK
MSSPVAHRPATLSRNLPALVLYDGECPLCLKSVDLVKRFDWLQRLKYVNLRETEKVPVRQPPLEPQRLLDEMHLITPDGKHVYHGFDAFRWMAWRMPALCWLAPLLYFPGVPALGQQIYLWVANNRYRLVPCHNGVCAVTARNTPS